MEHLEKEKARVTKRRLIAMLLNAAHSKRYHLLKTPHTKIPLRRAMPTAKSKADGNTYFKKLMCAASAGKWVNLKGCSEQDVIKKRWI